MALQAPVAEQAALVSVVVGAGAAWFGLYVNSTAGGTKKDSWLASSKTTTNK